MVQFPLFLNNNGLQKHFIIGRCVDCIGNRYNTAYTLISWVFGGQSITSTRYQGNFRPLSKVIRKKGQHIQILFLITRIMLAFVTLTKIPMKYLFYYLIQLYVTPVWKISTLWTFWTSERGVIYIIFCTYSASSVLVTYRISLSKL